MGKVAKLNRDDSLVEKYGPNAWKERAQPYYTGTNYMIQSDAVAKGLMQTMRKTYMLELLDRDGAWTKIFQDESKTQLTNTALRLHQILGVGVHARIRDYVTGTVYAEMDFSGED